MINVGEKWSRRAQGGAGLPRAGVVAAHDVFISLAWSGGLLVVFALLAARTYARMGR
jgi:hypothetical protein